MATLSTSRLVSCIAKTESSWADESTPPAGGSDDVTIIESENPWAPQIGVTAIRPHTSSFTKTSKSVIGTQLATVNLQGLLQGPATRGTPDNGTHGLIALFKSAGLHNTNTTGASGTISWAPATKAQTKSATVKVDLDGVVCSVPGCFGTNLELFGDTGANVKPRWRYTGLGKYIEPAIGTISGVTAPDRATSSLGATASITPSGGSAYTCANGLVLSSWVVRFPATVGQVQSICASTGVSELIHADRNPSMDLTIAVDVNDSANLDFEDIYGDLIGQTTHLVTLTWGTDPYKWKINVPTAELVNVSGTSTVSGYRVVTLTYDLFHVTANSEITIAVGNPS